jgi:hypothetical protein
MDILIKLIFAHFLFDYPLQADFLAKGKNPVNPLPNIPWYHCMIAHAFMHAAAVYFITNRLLFGFVEFVIHFVVDVEKCKGTIDYTQDQLLHILFKISYAILLYYFAF